MQIFTIRMDFFTTFWVDSNELVTQFLKKRRDIYKGMPNRNRTTFVAACEFGVMCQAARVRWSKSLGISQNLSWCILVFPRFWFWRRIIIFCLLICASVHRTNGNEPSQDGDRAVPSSVSALQALFQNVIDGSNVRDSSGRGRQAQTTGKLFCQNGGVKMYLIPLMDEVQF